MYGDALGNQINFACGFPIIVPSTKARFGSKKYHPTLKKISPPAKIFATNIAAAVSSLCKAQFGGGLSRPNLSTTPLV
jgi:hypothetical protein